MTIRSTNIARKNKFKTANDVTSISDANTLRTESERRSESNAAASSHTGRTR